MTDRPDADAFDALLDFYRSEYYRQLPCMQTIAHLYAQKLTGAEVIKASDAADINQIAALIPYASWLVLDKAIADKLRRTGLADRYGVRVYARRQLPDVVDELAGLCSRAQ